MRPIYRLGKAANAKGPPPGVGEHFRTRIADTWDGIRFEIGRMVETVRHQIGDPLVLDQMGWNLLTIEDEVERRNPFMMARAQFHWVRGATQYTPDPWRSEKLQSANRMVRMARVPKEIIMAATAPIYASLNGVELSKLSLSELPELPVRIPSDCDEQSILCATLCAACGIPTRFMLGANGNGEGFHHVFAQADVFGDGSDDSFWAGSMDATEPEFDEIGKFPAMDRYKPVEIWS